MKNNTKKLILLISLKLFAWVWLSGLLIGLIWATSEHLGWFWSSALWTVVFMFLLRMEGDRDGITRILLFPSSTYRRPASSPATGQGRSGHRYLH